MLKVTRKQKKKITQQEVDSCISTTETIERLNYEARLRRFDTCTSISLTVQITEYMCS